MLNPAGTAPSRSPHTSLVLRRPGREPPTVGRDDSRLRFPSECALFPSAHNVLKTLRLGARLGSFFQTDAGLYPCTMNIHAPAVVPPLVDPFGRAIAYVRVSVTDRCDYRCVYCMSEDMNFLPKRDVLSLEELDRLCSTFVSLGARKIRITGGEPLVRRNVMSLFHGLSRHLSAGTLDEVTVTTNGSQLARFASELADCGVRRVNPLDTLDPQKFRHVTRWGDLSVVLAGIDAASAAGLKVKINTVALKGFNEAEALDLVKWAHGRGFDLTFIEVMPLGDMERDRADQFLPLTELRDRLQNR